MPTLVEIVPYDDSWPQLFLEITKELRDILGPSAIAIEHIGSTAVPGLPAKPVIDVDVVLLTASHMASARAAFVALGYEARKNRYDDGVGAFLKRSCRPQQRVYFLSAGKSDARAAPRVSRLSAGSHGDRGSLCHSKDGAGQEVSL